LGKNSTLLKSIVISITAGIALYILVLAFSGYQETARAANLLSLGDWGIVLALSLLHFLLRFLRWHWYLGRLGHRVPWGQSAACYMAGFALTATPGKLGETIRSLYLKPYGVDYSHSLAAFFAERYTDLLAVATLSILALARFQSQAWPMIVAGALVLLALLLVRLPQIPIYLDRLQQRLRRPALQSGFGHLADALRASSSLLGLAALLSSYLVALLAWSAQALILYIVLVSMGQAIGIAAAIGIFALGLLAGALSFIPGGLGSTEAVMILLLLGIGVEAPDAAAATLLCRVATLWFAVAIGSVALLGVEVSRRGVGDDIET
jgi:uncharacterized protein (TIRG00374 family)